ncbi:PDZ domain-containing protein, partial [Escherichia coli]
DLVHDDLVKWKLGEKFEGVLIKSVENGGWANIAGIETDDLIISFNGKPTPTIESFKKILEEARAKKDARIVVFLRRGVGTRYCEIEPDWK